MTENNSLSTSTTEIKKCPTSIGEKMGDTENPKGRTGGERVICESEVQENKDAAVNQSSHVGRGIPHSEAPQDGRNARHAVHEPVSLPQQPKEGSKISAVKQEVSLNQRLEELTMQKTQMEAHIQSLKRRSQVLHNTSAHLKEEISEQYDEIRKKLKRDEEETIELVEEDTRIAVGKINKGIKEGSQQLEQIRKLIKSAQIELEPKGGATTKQEDKLHEHSEFNKKPFAMEQFEMDTPKFQKLLKLLQNISENLQAKLLKKSLLLDQKTVQLDATTSNQNIFISSDQTSMCLVSEPQKIANSPLRFDTMYNVLAASGWMRGKHYWEVDVRTSPAWSIGLAYGSIERKGNQRSIRLGRNRLSWSVEMYDGKLIAWHNDKAILCSKGISGMKQVGVHVDCERSKIVFYNAENMKVLQEFSSATAAFYDRLQHQFNEAVFPAFCLFPPKSGPITFERLQICNSSF